MAAIKQLRGVASVSKRATKAVVLHGTEDQIVEHGASAILLITSASRELLEVALDVGTWALIHCTDADDAASKAGAALDRIRDRAIEFGVSKESFTVYLSNMRRIARAVARGHVVEDLAPGLAGVAKTCPSEHSGRGRPKADKVKPARADTPVGANPRIKSFADDLARWADAVGENVGAPSLAAWMAANPQEAFTLLASYMNGQGAAPAPRRLRRAA